MRYSPKCSGKIIVYQSTQKTAKFLLAGQIIFDKQPEMDTCHDDPDHVVMSDVTPACENDTSDMQLKIDC